MSVFTLKGNNLVFKSGLKKDMPDLILGEIVKCNDEDKFYIGTESGAVEFTDFRLIATNLQFRRAKTSNGHFIGLNAEGYELYKKIHKDA